MFNHINETLIINVQLIFCSAWKFWWVFIIKYLKMYSLYYCLWQVYSIKMCTEIRIKENSKRRTQFFCDHNFNNWEDTKVLKLNSPIMYFSLPNTPMDLYWSQIIPNFYKQKSYFWFMRISKQYHEVGKQWNAWKWFYYNVQ